MLVALVCLVFNVYRLQKEVVKLQGDVNKSQSIVVSEMTKVHDLSTIMANANRHSLKNIREELDEAKKELAASAGQARVEAEANVQRLAKELNAEEQRQREIHDQVRRQLDDAHQAVASTDARLADVKTEVGSVKTEVGSVKTDVSQTQAALARAVSDLRRVIGDMGVMSGAIATNERELELLKAAGDRKYVSFRLPKTKEPQVVEGIGLVLKRTDPASRRFTLDVIAGDLRVQKRDRTINEPVQFYVSDNKKPYEMVINRIDRNDVAGYLAMPLKAEVRGGAGSSN